MTRRFRIASSLIQRLAELGLSTAQVLSRAGLPSALFEQERVLVSTEELFALYRSMEELSGDAAFGLKIGTEKRLERYDPVAIAALYARSLRDALQRIARFKQLTCPEAVHIVERGDECRVRFEWLLASNDEPAMLVDLCFAWVAEIARRGSAGVIKPMRLELKRPANVRQELEQHFGCAVQFEAKQNVLVLRSADLDDAFTTHNPEVLAMVAPQLEAELQLQLQGRSFREQAKVTIKRSLAGRRPELRSVARELGLSPRTLQRRLTEEGISFQQLVAEARRELARHYLQQGALELSETAYLLGYEDANSFFRAFHQWEGTSPGEWRAQLTP